MRACDPLAIALTITDGTENRTETVEFEVVPGLEAEIESWLDLYNGDDRAFVIDSRSIVEFDAEFNNPDDFDDLDDYADYVDKCLEYGEAYRLRYDDRGYHDNDDYCGCYDSAEDYVRDFYPDCHDIPKHLIGYIDWESLTRDIMMDHDEYVGSEGVHIYHA